MFHRITKLKSGVQMTKLATSSEEVLSKLKKKEAEKRAAP